MAGSFSLSKTDAEPLHVSAYTTVFKVIWALLKEHSTKPPFAEDAYYIKKISWYQTSFDCFLDLRKCSNEILVAIQSLLIDNANVSSPFWEKYRAESIEYISAQECETLSEAISRWEKEIRRTMFELADAISKRLQPDEAPLTTLIETERICHQDDPLSPEFPHGA